MSEVLVVAEEEAVVDGVQVETVEGWAEVVAVAVVSVDAIVVVVLVLRLALAGSSISASRLAFPVSART